MCFQSDCNILLVYFTRCFAGEHHLSVLVLWASWMLLSCEGEAMVLMLSTALGLSWPPSSWEVGYGLLHSRHSLGCLCGCAGLRLSTQSCAHLSLALAARMYPQSDCPQPGQNRLSSA